MSKTVRILSFVLPLVVAAFSMTRKPAVLGPFSISPYGLV
jgi:hypothetical protein